MIPQQQQTLEQLPVLVSQRVLVPQQSYAAPTQIQFTAQPQLQQNFALNNQPPPIK